MERKFKGLGDGGEIAAETENCMVKVVALGFGPVGPVQGFELVGGCIGRGQ